VPDDLLQGYTIVLTGVFETIGREKLEYFINNHSGRCTGSVSGKTSYLIHGCKLEDGRDYNQGNKYKLAVQKGVKILSEADFEKLIQDMSGNKEFTFNMRKAGLMAAAEVKPVILADPADIKQQMWTDRYKPRSVNDLIGNQAVVD
jgi:BRCT domain type II-containing protein